LVLRSLAYLFGCRRAEANTSNEQRGEQRLARDPRVTVTPCGSSGAIHLAQEYVILFGLAFIVYKSQDIHSFDGKKNE